MRLSHNRSLCIWGVQICFREFRNGFGSGRVAVVLVCGLFALFALDQARFCCQGIYAR